ncbi:uncharacterized protein LOC128735990 [Sabethes cyaneus]|uniref:uncharacterized protein LOC128735990 n=1 Tax=Sabethes cyaneus TaxID=53552 RepID=UPI00237E9CB7|nr:uncharacterized protein LOC128735990 [Sabethes cyaneus]
MDMPSFFSNYSNFRKLQRIVGYIRRFADNYRKQNPADRELRSHLAVHELRRATETIIHVVQHAHFTDEIKQVLDNESCKMLGNLCPIYTNGLLRVGGRLDRSQLPFESRHQIMLPGKDLVIHRFIQQMHVELLHVGQTGLLNALRQRYWLPKAPDPSSVSSPGPTLIKAYVAVFVCMATKAEHLEVVSDLSTDAFLASLRRLIARRGMIHELHSDNAINFRGVNHDLNSLYQQFQNQQAANSFVAAVKSSGTSSRQMHRSSAASGRRP